MKEGYHTITFSNITACRSYMCIRSTFRIGMHMVSGAWCSGYEVVVNLTKRRETQAIFVLISTVTAAPCLGMKYFHIAIKRVKSFSFVSVSFFFTFLGEGGEGAIITFMEHNNKQDMVVKRKLSKSLHVPLGRRGPVRIRMPLVFCS